MKKLFLILIAVFGIYASSSAQSADISYISLEHNVRYSGTNCLAVHICCSVDDLKGRTVNITAYFFDDYGNPIKAPYGAPGQFRTTDGQLCVGCNVRVTYENTYWDDCVLYIPYGMFQQSGSYQCAVQISNSSYGVLARSSEEYFDVYR